LIVGLAAVAVAAIAAASATAGAPVAGKDGNTQSLEAVVSPKKLSKTTPTPVTLSVSVPTRTTTAASGIPVPTVHVTIDFDKNLSLFTKGIPTCNATKLQATSTEVAKQACGNAVIGTGTGSALLPIGGQAVPEPTVVTAFNGVPQGGKPIELLHAYGTSPVQTTLVLVGTISNYNKEGFGPRLDVEVPKIAGGTGALTDFKVKINKRYRYKGHPRSFVSAKCPSSKKLKARALFTYADGETLTPLSTQSCKQLK
jgi:hypothetical protein